MKVRKSKLIISKPAITHQDSKSFYNSLLLCMEKVFIKGELIKHALTKYNIVVLLAENCGAYAKENSIEIHKYFNAVLLFADTLPAFGYNII